MTITIDWHWIWINVGGIIAVCTFTPALLKLVLGRTKIDAAIRGHRGADGLYQGGIPEEQRPLAWAVVSLISVQMLLIIGTLGLTGSVFRVLNTVNSNQQAVSALLNQRTPAIAALGAHDTDILNNQKEFRGTYHQIVLTQKEILAVLKGRR